MQLEVDPDGNVYYNEILFALMKRKFGTRLSFKKNLIE
jgi:hypothetical protein